MPGSRSFNLILRANSDAPTLSSGASVSGGCATASRKLFTTHGLAGLMRLSVRWTRLWRCLHPPRLQLAGRGTDAARCAGYGDE